MDFAQVKTQFDLFVILALVTLSDVVQTSTQANFV